MGLGLPYTSQCRKAWELGFTMIESGPGTMPIGTEIGQKRQYKI